MKKVLLVDAEPLSRRVLDVSLRKLGFQVATATDGADALVKVGAFGPNLLVTDTHLPSTLGFDGFALARALRDRVESSSLPIIFLTSHDSAECRGRARELGVADLLAKPAFVSELVARIHLLLSRGAQVRLSSAHAPADGSRFAGSTAELTLVDVLQGFQSSRESGVIYVRNEMQEARISCRGGEVVAAELGPLRGEEAVYRALLWADASLTVEWRPVTCPDTLGSSMRTLLINGMQRVDEWLRLSEDVKPLSALFGMNPPQLLERLGSLREIPETLDAFLGKRPSPEAHPALPEAAFHPASLGPRPPLVTSSMTDTLASPGHSFGLALTPAASHEVVPTSATPTSADEAGAIGAIANDATPADAVPPVPQGTVAQRRSDAPWTTDVEPNEDEDSERTDDSELSDEGGRHHPHEPEYALEDRDGDVAAGLPPVFRKGARLATLGAVAAAALILGVAGLSVVRSHPLRVAAVDRTDKDGLTAVAAAAEMTLPSAPAPFVALAEPIAIGAPSVAAVPPAPLGLAGDVNNDAPHARPVEQRLADPFSTPHGAPVDVSAPREAPIDAKVQPNRQSPQVREAEHALLKGDLTGALALSRQAVATNPADAEGWLTLAAAARASGDGAGAREAYRGCIARAHTVGATHCRVLAMQSTK